MARLNTKRFFRDSNGQITIWQSPNLLLSAWIIFEVIKLIVSKGKLKTGLEQLSSVTLFAWAYLEATTGVNYFRKVLGLLVLIIIIVGFFR